MRDLVAVVRFSDVFQLVREGILTAVAVLYQGYWMYQQGQDYDGVLFPGSVPVLSNVRDISSRVIMSSVAA